MPGIVRSAAATLVMPDSLSAAFQEVHQFVSLINVYPDGSANRKTLHSEPRKKFVLTKRLRAPLRVNEQPGTKTPYMLLRDLWDDTRCGVDAFFFYNYREGTYDPLGISELGRYKVVFRGAFTETLGLGERSECGLMLEEVE